MLRHGECSEVPIALFGATQNAERFFVVPDGPPYLFRLRKWPHFHNASVVWQKMMMSYTPISDPMALDSHFQEFWWSYLLFSVGADVFWPFGCARCPCPPKSSFCSAPLCQRSAFQFSLPSFVEFLVRRGFRQTLSHTRHERSLRSKPAYSHMRQGSRFSCSCPCLFPIVTCGNGLA